MNIQSIEAAISSARLGTYEAACPQGPEQKADALRFYAWNAQVSASLLAPLHICEVVKRNAVSDALEAVYGPRWPWSQGFARSLPSPNSGYSPLKDLKSARRGQSTTGKVIPELKFVFWQKLFTSRFNQRIWRSHLRRVLPNLPSGKTDSQCRKLIYSELEKIRHLRNRIAHHEPIFSRDLSEDLKRISDLIKFRCLETAKWMDMHQNVTKIIQERPNF